MTGDAIRIEHLTRDFGRIRALDDLSLALATTTVALRRFRRAGLIDL